MTDDPLDELLEEQEELAELIESAIAIWESLPLIVWLILAIVVIKLVSDWMKPNEYDSSSTLPSEQRTVERTDDGPSRERYSIHDDLDAERDYEPPSESDPIETPNQVDRGILGAMRRLAGMLRGGSRGRD